MWSGLKKIGSKVGVTDFMIEDLSVAQKCPMPLLHGISFNIPADPELFWEQRRVSCSVWEAHPLGQGL